MTNHWFFWAFLIAFILHEVWETLLSVLNRKRLQEHAGAPPTYFQGKIDVETYRKSVAYNLETSRFGLWMSFLGIGAIWAAILLGVFQWLDAKIGAYALSPLFHSVAYCMAVALGLTILQIPASLYSQFVLEEKYGFNKMTAKTFIMDLIKGLFLGALLGIPLLCLLFWLYQKAGGLWWLWAFAAFFGFQLFLAAIYPIWIAPLFNKFKPLEEGSLKQKIFEIAQKIRFQLSGIYVIDGSKRSAHSNAYFAGLGRFRRIVLFDTLLKQMNEPEIVSVLAHEMGHNKKRHIQKQLVFSFFLTLAGFWLLAQLMNWTPFYQVFQAGAPAPHKALVLFSLFGGYFTFFLTPLSNYLSRKYEFEADRFSAETTGDSPSMISALIALSKENLSNLTPHPLYSFYHYTHPTTLERIRALETK